MKVCQQRIILDPRPDTGELHVELITEDNKGFRPPRVDNIGITLLVWSESNAEVAKVEKHATGISGRGHVAVFELPASNQQIKCSAHQYADEHGKGEHNRIKIAETKWLLLTS